MWGVIVLIPDHYLSIYLACQAKGLSCHTKNQPLSKHLRKERVKVQSSACYYATKKTRYINNVFEIGHHN